VRADIARVATQISSDSGTLEIMMGFGSRMRYPTSAEAIRKAQEIALILGEGGRIHP
jgi:hypothetical protein